MLITKKTSRRIYKEKKKHISIYSIGAVQLIEIASTGRREHENRLSSTIHLIYKYKKKARRKKNAKLQLYDGFTKKYHYYYYHKKPVLNSLGSYLDEERRYLCRTIKLGIVHIHFTLRTATTCLVIPFFFGLYLSYNVRCLCVC